MNAQSPQASPTFLHRLAATCQNPGWLWLLGILCFTIALYGQTLSFDFVFDDHLQIKQNLNIRSWSNIDKAFSAHVWAGQEGYGVTNSYRPLYLVWFTANYGLFGQQPLGWHFTTLAAYLVSIGCVWWLAGMVLGRNPAQIIATMVFAWHPTHVEVGSWIAAICDPLVMIFFTIASALYLHSRNAWVRDRSLPKQLWFGWLSAGTLLLALLTKEFAVFWGPMWFIYECLAPAPGMPPAWWKRLGTTFRLLLPHIAITSVYLVIHKIVIPEPLVGQPELNSETVFCTAPLILLTYLKLLVWPVNLRLEYELGYVTSLTNLWFWLPLLLLLLGGSGFLILTRRRRNAWVFALWTVLPLLPALLIWHFRNGEFLHDRYLFLPSLGFSFLVGWLVRGRADQQWNLEPNEPVPPVGSSPKVLVPPYRNPLLLALAGCLVLALLNLPLIPVWKNDEALYRNILHYHPNNIFALGNLSQVYRDQQRYDLEILQLERILQLRPRELGYRYILATAYNRQQRFVDVARTLAYAETYDPNFTTDHQRCYLYSMVLFLLNQPAKSKRFIEIAIAQETNKPAYWMLLGDVAAATGDQATAARTYRAFMVIDPQNKAEAQAKLDRLHIPAP
ncbi:MAG: hypothetical protein K1Y36_17020 [Blastocatellia bacterium]|nr:hypothetical protein [Blastocatellia bacterium]